MKAALLAFLAVLAFPAAARAADVTLRSQDVPLGGGRALAASRAPERFDLVGLHWQGRGSVAFRTRSVAGRWSAWRAAAPEAEDLPDPAGGEGTATRGWRVGNPYWTGPSDRIQYRLHGAVRSLRAFFVASPVERVPTRELTVAGSPAIVPRLSWGANESIRRRPPQYFDAVRFAIVHHTAGSNDYGPAESAAIVRGIEVYHVEANGWNDIGYNFLVDRYGQVFEGRYGGIERNVLGAHALGFNNGSFGVAVIGNYGSAPISAAARSALARLLAWRLDVAHVDPLSSLTWASSGNERFPTGTPVFLRAVSGHRDTGLTTCPGNALYAQLGSIAGTAAATGLPKLFAPQAQGKLGAPVRFTARLSAPLAWTVTVADVAGAVVASGSGSGAAVDWTWDASLAPPGAYRWTISAGPAVRPATGTIGAKATVLALTKVGASLPSFSPNGDGHDEQTTVSYTLSTAAIVTATLVRADGTAAATLFSQPKRAGRQSFVFRAQGLPDGVYRIVLTARAPDGKEVTASAAVTVNRTLAGFAVSPRLFSPNGDGRLDRLAFSFSLAYPVQAELRVETAKGVSVDAVFAGALAAGPQRLAWDGRTAGGVLADGDYRATLTVDDALGTTAQAVAFRSDTRPPRLSLLSLRRLRFRLDEPATVTLDVNGRRIRKLEPKGVFTVPFRGVPAALSAFAEDAAGNRTRALRVP